MTPKCRRPFIQREGHAQRGQDRFCGGRRLELSVAAALSVLSGALVGFILGFIGSGGSILALPLLVYVVGYAGDPHVAIGTTALAVAVSALVNVVQHARLGNVRVREGLMFAAPGVVGALAGAWLGLLTDGERILFLFALVMLVVAYRMWKSPAPGASKTSEVRPPPSKVMPRILPAGLAVGGLSGFFGIGGGFLIVPALGWAAKMDVRRAIGTSLLAVATFGFATAARYGLAGKLDLPVAGLFIAGGIAGGVLGTTLSARAPQKLLRQVFAGVLVVVAFYMMWKNYTAFG